MYKIYINNTPLQFLPIQYDQQSFLPEEPDVLAGVYTGKTKFLMHYIDMLEKSSSYKLVNIYAKDAKAAYKDFKSLFRFIRAAGGVVFNAQGQLLVIYRRGNWDLPKGKIDPGEKKKAAALREVREECGLIDLVVNNKLSPTYHTYREKDGSRVLKKTHWYKMQTKDTLLIPQQEEDIELAEWVDIQGFLKSEKKMYGNIREVLQSTLYY